MIFEGGDYRMKKCNQNTNYEEKTILYGACAEKRLIYYGFAEKEYLGELESLKEKKDLDFYGRVIYKAREYNTSEKKIIAKYLVGNISLEEEALLRKPKSRGNIIKFGIKFNSNPKFFKFDKKTDIDRIFHKGLQYDIIGEFIFRDNLKECLNNRAKLDNDFDQILHFIKQSMS